MKTPKIFISHSEIDKEIAKKFAYLINEQFSGVIKTFQSYSKNSETGVDYGQDWYDSILKEIDESFVVICLVTEAALNRPWILFEAGVAKGKSNKKVFGVTLGIESKKLEKGPFGRFKNCSGDKASLVELLGQLGENVNESNPIKLEVSNKITATRVERFVKEYKEILKERSIVSEINTETISRSEAQEMNRDAFLDASDELLSFSGDLSWVDNLIDEIIARRPPLKIRVLCIDPSTTENKDAATKLFGVKQLELKYYTKTDNPRIRGYIIDPSSGDEYSHFFAKPPAEKQSFSRKVHTENTDGRHLTTFSHENHNSRMQFAMIAYFELLWERGSSSTSIMRNEEDRAKVIECLKSSVEQYRNSEISFAKVNVKDLKALHKFLKSDRLDSIDSLFERRNDHVVDLCELFSLEFKDHKQIIPPPIVEYHKDKGEHFIIDGLHRVYTLRKGTYKQDFVWCCVVDSPPQELPGKSISWSDIKVLPPSELDNEVNRDDNFNQYKVINWRDLSSFFAKLSTPRARI